MMLAGAALASSALASQTPLSTALTDADTARPIHVYIDDVARDTDVLIESLTIEDPLGEPTTCAFRIVNPITVPYEGASVRIVYFSETLFSGTIKSIRRTVNNLATFKSYECNCVDWSEILTRHKIRRNFTHLPPENVIDSLLDNELAGNGLTVGTIDLGLSVPLVDSRGGSAFDVLRELAAVTGQSLRIDFDKTIDFLAISAPAAPSALTADTVNRAETEITRDDYRNVQIVRVTGTPPEGSNDDSAQVDVIEQSDEQIAARIALEGGDGKHEAFDEITHPTSNVPAILVLLGKSVAIAKLAVAGVPQVTLRCQIHGYGFRAGQVASATFTALDVTGSWSIQRAALRIEQGRYLVYDLELTKQTALQRAYDSWLRVVERGKIVVQMPGTTLPTTTVETFSAPGAANWVVPAGVTSVLLTTKGGSGSAGGGISIAFSAGGCFYNDYPGGRGGHSGKVVTALIVTPGQTLNLTIGAAGSPGGIPKYYNCDGSTCQQNLGRTPGGTPTDGAAGTASTIFRSGILVSQADGGGAGTKATGPFFGCSGVDGTAGTHGGGSNGIVTVGGGKTGGARVPAGTGGVGSAGEITIEYTL